MKQASPLWSTAALTLLGLNLLCPFVVSLVAAPWDGPTRSLMATHHYFQLAALILIWWSGRDRRTYIHLSLLTLAMVLAGARGLYSPLTMNAVWALAGLIAVSSAARLSHPWPNPEAEDSARRFKNLAAVPAAVHIILNAVYGLTGVAAGPGAPFNRLLPLCLIFAVLPAALLAAARRRTDLLALAALGGAALVGADLWIGLAAAAEGPEAAVQRLIALWAVGLPLTQLLAQAAVLVGVLILVYRRLGEVSAFGDDPPRPSPVFSPRRRAALLFTAGAAMSAVFLGAAVYFNKSEIVPGALAVQSEDHRLGPLTVKLPRGLEISAWGVSLLRDGQRVWLNETPASGPDETLSLLNHFRLNGSGPGQAEPGENADFSHRLGRPAWVVVKPLYEPPDELDHDQNQPPDQPPNRLRLEAAVMYDHGLVTLVQHIPYSPEPIKGLAPKAFRLLARDRFIEWCVRVMPGYRWLQPGDPVPPKAFKTAHGLLPPDLEAGVNVWFRQTSAFFVAAVFWNPGPEVFILSERPSTLRRVMAYYRGEVYDYQPRAVNGQPGLQTIRYPGDRPDPYFSQGNLSFTWLPDNDGFPLYLYLADSGYLGGGDYPALLSLWESIEVEATGLQEGGGSAPSGQ